MSEETFTERFNRLTADLEDWELMRLLAIGDAAIRKIRNGGTLSLGLDGGLRLAERLGVSPWLFTATPERATQPANAPIADEMALDSKDGLAAMARSIRELQTTVAELGAKVAAQEAAPHRRARAG